MFGVPGLCSVSSDRSHWPMHGPQALAKTTAPRASKSAKRPSLVIVALTCSDPGVIKSRHLALIPNAAASLAIEAALVMSS